MMIASVIALRLPRKIKTLPQSNMELKLPSAERKYFRIVERAENVENERVSRLRSETVRVLWARNLDELVNV